ncbi:MAG: TlpA disulfide reductase family protein [Acidobacteriia bacterium]|nr:TlpA disulfide reductase family protein [Terriglobia bacterium]
MPAEIGKAAPNFSLQDENGHSVQLSDYRGRYVVLNFWATWCPPCVEEAPSLDKLNRRFAATSPSRIAVLTVSADPDWAPVKLFVKEHDISFPVLLDKRQEVPSIYGTYKYPETYIIDPQGVVRQKVIGGYNWVSADALRFFDGLLQQGGSPGDI